MIYLCNIKRIILINIINSTTTTTTKLLLFLLGEKNEIRNRTKRIIKTY